MTAESSNQYVGLEQLSGTKKIHFQITNELAENLILNVDNEG